MLLIDFGSDGRCDDVPVYDNTYRKLQYIVVHGICLFIVGVLCFVGLDGRSNEREKDWCYRIDRKIGVSRSVLVLYFILRLINTYKWYVLVSPDVANKMMKHDEPGRRRHQLLLYFEVYNGWHRDQMMTSLCSPIQPSDGEWCVIEPNDHTVRV